MKAVKGSKPGGEVELVDSSENGDDLLVASLIHTVSQASFSDCKKAVGKMNTAEKNEIVKASMKRMEFFDANLQGVRTREPDVRSCSFGLVLRAVEAAQDVHADHAGL